jgi:hypothetical protein
MMRKASENYNWLKCRKNKGQMIEFGCLLLDDKSLKGHRHSNNGNE